MKQFWTVLLAVIVGLFVVKWICAVDRDIMRAYDEFKNPAKYVR
jgi:hypothetical protein